MLFIIIIIITILGSENNNFYSLVGRNPVFCKYQSAPSAACSAASFFLPRGSPKHSKFLESSISRTTLKVNLHFILQ